MLLDIPKTAEDLDSTLDFAQKTFCKFKPEIGNKWE